MRAAQLVDWQHAQESKSLSGPSFSFPAPFPRLSDALDVIQGADDCLLSCLSHQLHLSQSADEEGRSYSAQMLNKLSTSSKAAQALSSSLSFL